MIVSVSIAIAIASCVIAILACRKIDKLHLWIEKDRIGILECEVQDLRKHIMKRTK